MSELVPDCRMCQGSISWGDMDPVDPPVCHSCAYDRIDQLQAQLAAAREENGRLREAAKAFQELKACYRIGRRPSKNENPYQKYTNQDTRCRYPFSPDPAGYCWSFANHVDGSGGYEDMLEICLGCEFWMEAADAS